MSNYIYYDYMTSSVCKVKEDSIESSYSTSLQSYFNQQCLLNGSSLKGRQASYQHFIPQKKYLPIPISKEEIYFPNEATNHSSCLYINYFEIQSIEYKEKTCIIHFKDNTCLTCQNPKRIQSLIQRIQRYLLILNP